MIISYNKLWKLLIDKKLSKVDLRKNADIAPNTMTKLRRDEPVSMLILLKIAEYLECDISDMCEFVKEEKWYELWKNSRKETQIWTKQA